MRQPTILPAAARRKKRRPRLRTAEDLWRDLAFAESLPHDERVAATRSLFAEAEILYARAEANSDALRTAWERLGRALMGQPKA